MSDNKKEVEKYKKLADVGDVEAMYKYAYMQENNQEVTWQSIKKEVSDYYFMAAEKGHVDAMYRYASILDNDGYKNPAVNYYKAAAEKGHIDAMYKYAGMLRFGIKVKEDTKEALKYYKMAADKGNDMAMYAYAEMLEDEKNIKEALKYYKMAADKGNNMAMYAYAEMLLKGKGIKQNKQEALKYYKMAADKGHINSKNKLEQISKDDNEIINENKKEIKEYHKVTADKSASKVFTDEKIFETMYKKAKDLYNGEKVDINREELIKFFKDKIKDDTNAKFVYAMLLESTDINKAFEYYKEALDDTKNYKNKKYVFDVKDIENKIKDIKNNTINSKSVNFLKKDDLIKALDKNYNKNIKNTNEAFVDEKEFEARYEEAEDLYDSEEIDFDKKKELMKFFKDKIDKKIDKDINTTNAKFMYAMLLESSDINEAFKYYKEVLNEVKDGKEYFFNTDALENKIKDIENDIVNATEVDSLEESDLKKVAEEQRYKIVKKLGEGAFGATYHAKKIIGKNEKGENILSEESYAIKFPIRYDNNIKTLKQLEEKKEVQTLIDLAGSGHTKKIDGFNVKLRGRKEVSQIEVFKIREKGDLEKLLAPVVSGLTPEELRDGFPGIAYLVQSATSYNNLHKLGVIHRDIKLENTLIGETPEDFYNNERYKDCLRIKTADYGTSTTNKDNINYGTPANMAPELFDYEKQFIDNKVDVYSMAIMFTKILSAKGVKFKDTDLFDLDEEEQKKLEVNPFEYLPEFRKNKELNKEKLKKILSDACISLFPNNEFDTETVNDIEKEILDLLLGMFEKNPEKRLSLNQVIEKLGKIVLRTGLSPEDLEQLYGISEKDLYGLGIFTETNLNEHEAKIKKDLEQLKEEGKSKDFKEQTHLDTLTGKKELSDECKRCLGNLLSCFGGKEGEINLKNLKNNEKFKKDLEEIRKSGNQREYLLVVSRISDMKELKMNYEIFRLEKIKKELKQNREKDGKKEETEEELKIDAQIKKIKKMKEEKEETMRKHAKLSRMSSVIKERTENKETKKELEKLLDIESEFPFMEKETGIER